MDGRSVVVGGRFLPFLSPCCCVYGKPELVREIHVAKTRDLRDYAKTEQTKRRNRKLVRTRERDTAECGLKRTIGVVRVVVVDRGAILSVAVGKDL